jgi:GNAT superfamily N-acetyltransferase
VELDRRTPGEIELAYFGLFPQFIGNGLGKYLLAWALRQAWSYGPRRVWVHTCDLDHEAALPTYLNAGFTVYAEKMVEQAVPED